MSNQDAPVVRDPENDANGTAPVVRTEQQRNLESWLPITASRKAKWWYSAFHNVTAMVGAGVLGLPFAMSQLGWIPGILAIFFSWLITLYSLWQLVELHEIVPGRRFDRYHELGQHAFGKKRGYWIVMPQQLIVQVASDIVYMVTGGKSLKKFFDLVFPSLSTIRQTYFILFFAGLQFLISQTPNFNSLKGVSLLAAVMSVSYSMIAFVTSMIRGSEHHPNTYGVRSDTIAGMVFDVFNGLGTIAFAFAGHSVVLEIQATIPSSPGKPSSKPMWLGVVAAYAIVAFCYFSVAISGFWAFGDLVEDDILVSLEKPVWLIAVANLMVFFHVLGSYQIFAMPVFDMIESNLVQNLHFTPGRPLRLIGRSSYVAPLYNMAYAMPAKDVELPLDCMLDFNHRRRLDNDPCTYRRSTPNYSICQKLRILFLVVIDSVGTPEEKGSPLLSCF
ncbi:hypothetical protein HHK36_004478 [Tetracentron sinense]|uniref:Amino acid transporter transmembrane domain-containing protein n=1 Tax=Tetracentron sinense TaxID=13715 RepID=A0A834ZQZ5_TETSI|nr:hypothetical protein HHK36_004478 [Tetracentron sinense]